ncbi:uncharacterized protein ACBR49_011476 [Aulostomus maculatus]
MSAGVVNIQAQVESVLGALVKVATAELTKLFESRYRASAAEEYAGRSDDRKRNETSETVKTLAAGERRRSIGVQVDEDICPPTDFSGPPVLPEEASVRGCREDEDEAEGCLTRAEPLPVEDGACVDPGGSPVMEQAVAEAVGAAEPPPDGVPHTEAVVQVSTDLRHGSSKSSPTKQMRLVIRPDTRDIKSGKKKKFVCPLILKPESPAPKPDSSETSEQAEPQQACVSTAKGTAYSPSPFDGAVTPAQAGVWERIHTAKDPKNQLQMTLKLTSPDQKLTHPCEVQLVNVLTVPKKLQDDGANSKTGCSLPKDLRRHQGLHTGHRLCCFTPCGDGVWRLQNIVSRSHDGYTCSICGKAFKRRKILRRHERFHTGEKPYPCSQCSKTFALRKSLRRHLRFHTGERPHTCTHCSKSFRLRDNLKAHLRFHTGEKPFSCTSCGKMFRILRNLEKHKLGQCGFLVPSFRTIAGL